MGNLTSITKFRHFSGLTITASNSLPNSTANRYAQGVQRQRPDKKGIDKTPPKEE